MPEWKTVVRARLESSSPRQSDVVDELAQHAEAVYQRARADGASEAEALAAVDRELDDLSEVERAIKVRRGGGRALPEPAQRHRGEAGTIAAFLADSAYAFRLLKARPAFTLAAVLTLALGIGANTAIFSVVHALLLAPLPFANPDRLVMVWESDNGRAGTAFIVSEPNWQDWRRQSTSLKDFAIWEFQSFNISGGAEPEQVTGLRVSAGVFALLGVRPQLGRTFTAEEDDQRQRVVVMSDALWTRRFGRNPSIVGQTMRVNGESYEVIGVMPASFRFVQKDALWVPMHFKPLDHERNAHSFYSAARIADGVSFEAAREEIGAVGRRVLESHQDDPREHVPTITRMAEFGVEPLRPTLVALVGAVALVLLIACVNVANLMLAQAAVRRREFAIRAALGAARGRMASQLLAEGLILALLGGAGGVLLASLGTQVMAGSLPPAIKLAPFRVVDTVAIDGRILAFTFAVALVTGVLFSLAPMLGASRTHPGSVMKTAGDRSGTGRMRMVRHGLVAAELALAVVILFAAGLMIKSVVRLLSVDPGLDDRNVLLMSISLPQDDTYGPPTRTSFCADLQREVASLPGVRSVGAISHLPLSGANAGRGLSIEGRPIPTPNERVSANYRLTCPGYFATLGIPLVKGRDFNDTDTINAPGAVIINEEMARRHFPGEQPIGQRLKLGSPTSSQPWLTIVGVARDVRHFGLDTPSRREIFRPYSQAVWPEMTITVKSVAAPTTLALAARGALARIDPEQPVSRIRTMEDVVSDSIGGRRFPMLLLAIFSAVALILAAIGVYGVVSYLVSQRTREMGIRVALGARRPQVVQLVVFSSLRPIVAGLIVGVGGAILASGLLSTLLYAVTPSDPAVLAGIVSILGATATAACWLPARRAASVDPLVALREE